MKYVMTYNDYCVSYVMAIISVQKQQLFVKNISVCLFSAQSDQYISYFFLHVNVKIKILNS